MVIFDFDTWLMLDYDHDVYYKLDSLFIFPYTTVHRYYWLCKYKVGDFLRSKIEWLKIIG